MRSPPLARAALAVLLLVGCQGPEARDGPRPARPVTDPAAEDYDAPPLPRARVLFEDAYGGGRSVQVEVAATPEARTRGLMWRRSLPEGQGMLFVFPAEKDHGFWMQNTFISLDMVFIDLQGRVVGIVERAEPHSFVSRSVGRPSRYVLEVPGGWAQSAGLRTGSQVRFEGLGGVTAQP